MSSQALKLIPIKWEPQFSKELRPKPLKTDGAYGKVNGDLLFFVYQTSDPYCKGWRSWVKSERRNNPADDAKFSYRTHWNVWLYFGSNEQPPIRGLKSMRHAKRAARRLLLKKINAMLR